MRARVADLRPRLDERDGRVAMATEAKSWGRGGISAVHRATGASRTTIRRGMDELAEDEPTRPGRRVRAPGGGRKQAEVTDPELLDALDALIEPGTRGDPESPLRWTTKSTRQLAGELRGATPSAIRSSRTFFIPADTAYKPPARPWKGASTPTGTPSSGTSTPSPRSSSPAVTL